MISLILGGAFPISENVSVKVRAYEAPYPDLDGPGHDLAADCIDGRVLIPRLE